MDVLNGYRDNCNESFGSSDESEDSDNECTVWKRAVRKPTETEGVIKVQAEELTSIPTQKAKRRKNTVWSDILQDQLISEDFSSCLLKNRPAHYKNRGHESYDYTLKYADSEISKDSDVAMSEEISCESEKKFVPSQHNKYKKFVKLDSAERTAAQKINKVLHEKKAYLICRIVKFVGIEKAMTLLKMTEQVEESGGMMIKNNTRRRTPGGVYIQLLKNDKEVTKEMLDKIFEGEMTSMDMKKFYAEQKKKRRSGKKQKFQTLKEGIQLQKTECEEVKNMEVSEMCDEATPSSDITFMENDFCSIPAPLTNKSDSELEEGEIDD